MRLIHAQIGYLPGEIKMTLPSDIAQTLLQVLNFDLLYSETGLTREPCQLKPSDLALVLQYGTGPSSHQNNRC
jgi:hypothetical protein